MPVGPTQGTPNQSLEELRRQNSKQAMELSQNTEAIEEAFQTQQVPGSNLDIRQSIERSIESHKSNGVDERDAMKMACLEQLPADSSLDQTFNTIFQKDPLLGFLYATDKNKFIEKLKTQEPNPQLQQILEILKQDHSTLRACLAQLPHDRSLDQTFNTIFQKDPLQGFLFATDKNKFIETLQHQEQNPQLQQILESLKQDHSALNEITTVMFTEPESSFEDAVKVHCLSKLQGKNLIADFEVMFEGHKNLAFHFTNPTSRQEASIEYLNAIDGFNEKYLSATTNQEIQKAEANHLKKMKAIKGKEIKENQQLEELNANPSAKSQTKQSQKYRREVLQETHATNIQELIRSQVPNLPPSKERIETIQEKLKAKPYQEALKAFNILIEDQRLSPAEIAVIFCELQQADVESKLPNIAHAIQLFKNAHNEELTDIPSLLQLIQNQPANTQITLQYDTAQKILDDACKSMGLDVTPEEFNQDLQYIYEGRTGSRSPVARNLKLVRAQFAKSYGYPLRENQVVSAYLLSKAQEQTSKSKKKTQSQAAAKLSLSKLANILEISTGQGKANIAAVVAATTAKCGFYQHQVVCVPTSALAHSDYSSAEILFESLGLISKLSENVKGEKPNIIYASYQDFQGDEIRQKYDFSQTSIILDEADKAILDEVETGVSLTMPIKEQEIFQLFLATLYYTQQDYTQHASTENSRPLNNSSTLPSSIQSLAQTILLKPFFLHNTDVSHLRALHEFDEQLPKLETSLQNIATNEDITIRELRELHEQLGELETSSETPLEKCQYRLFRKLLNLEIQKLDPKTPGNTAINFSDSTSPLEAMCIGEPSKAQQVLNKLNEDRDIPANSYEMIPSVLDSLKTLDEPLAQEISQLLAQLNSTVGERGNNSFLKKVVKIKERLSAWKKHKKSLAEADDQTKRAIFKIENLLKSPVLQGYDQKLITQKKNQNPTKEDQLRQVQTKRDYYQLLEIEIALPKCQVRSADILQSNMVFSDLATKMQIAITDDPRLCSVSVGGSGPKINITTALQQVGCITGFTGTIPSEFELAIASTKIGSPLKKGKVADFTKSRLQAKPDIKAGRSIKERATAIFEKIQENPEHATLITAEDIDDANQLKAEISRLIKQQGITAIKTLEDIYEGNVLNPVDQELPDIPINPGEIRFTIANAGGRGTDWKPNSTLGLHSINAAVNKEKQTPREVRQIMGRAARSGAKGIASLVVCKDSWEAAEESNILIEAFENQNMQALEAVLGESSEFEKLESDIRWQNDAFASKCQELCQNQLERVFPDKQKEINWSAFKNSRERGEPGIDGQKDLTSIFEDFARDGNLNTYISEMASLLLDPAYFAPDEITKTTRHFEQQESLVKFQTLKETRESSLNQIKQAQLLINLSKQSGQIATTISPNASLENLTALTQLLAQDYLSERLTNDEILKYSGFIISIMKLDQSQTEHVQQCLRNFITQANALKAQDQSQ